MWKLILSVSICAAQVQGATIRGRSSDSQQTLKSFITASDAAEPIAVEPKVWPHKDQQTAPREVVTAAPTTEVTQAPGAGVPQAPMTASSTTANYKDTLEEGISGPDAKGQKTVGARKDWSAVPHVIATWVVLIIASVAGNKVMKAWNSQQRAPYIAFGMILWTILISATVFFFLSTHEWRWLECIYFCIVTITTVGYGDFVPEDTVLDKFLLIGFLWFNMAVLSIVMSIVLAKIPENTSSSDKGNGLGFQSAVLLGIVLGGSFMFMALEGWTFIEALQFVTVTVTTVGYGHLLPSRTTPALLCASVFILLGVPVTGAFVGKLGSTIDNYFSVYKMKMSDAKKSAVYVAIILGWLVIGGTGFHMFNTHGWNWTKCFYLAAVTMTTVGYGDFVPSRAMTDHILVIVFIWCSVIVIAVVSSDLIGIIITAVTKSMERAKQFQVQLGLLAAIMVTGIIAMEFLEGWGVLNGLVYVSVTCTTVGYGRLVPSTDHARLFSVPFLLIAVPMTGALVSNTSDKYKDEISSFVQHEDDNTLKS